MRIPRRLAPFLLAVAPLLVTGCASEPASSTPVLTGAWRSSVQFKNGAFAEIRNLEFLYVFNAGGTMTESSNYDAAPPVAPAYGAWQATGPNQFEAHYEFFVTIPTPPEAFQKGGGWLPAGRGVFTERITVADDGRSFTSTIAYEPFDARGNPAEGGGEATGRGTRIGTAQ